MQSRIFVEPIKAKAVHIDSVQLSHGYRAADLPPPDELFRMGFEVKVKDRDGNLIHTALLKPKSLEPDILIILSEYGYCGIKMSCSIAKLVSGNGLGVQKDEDIECALDSMEGFIQQKTGVSFDVSSAQVHRFDANADFLVGEDRVRLYEAAISRPNARLVPASFGTTTKYFSNKSQGYAVYGKGEEMKSQLKKGKVIEDDVLEAEGVLRVERRLYNKSTIDRFAKKHALKARAGEILKMSVAQLLVNETLSQLRLDKERFSAEARFDLLIKYFGKNAPEKLGILMYRELLGDDFWKKLGWDNQMLYRKKKPLMEANLWDVSPAEALPALVVPNDL